VDLRDQLLALLTDGPATVQMRALLELGETQLFGTVEGAAFAHAEAALGVLIGRPTEKTLRELTLCGLPPELVAHEPVELAGYTWEAVSLSTEGPSTSLRLSGFDQLRSRRAESRRLSPAQWPLVSPKLSETLAIAMERRAVFFEAVDEQPVAFAWAPLKSEHWFDLHVETMPAFRRRGLGRNVVRAVIAHERNEGRSPVWGAAASNTAAVALGRSLGFTDCGQMLWRATKRV
jgi:ribosomal protein S18 acetylase RimI-like enzyme